MLVPPSCLWASRTLSWPCRARGPCRERAVWEAARRGQVGAVVGPRASPSPVAVLGTAGGGDPERGGGGWDASPLSRSWEISGVHREGGLEGRHWRHL